MKKKQQLWLDKLLNTEVAKCIYWPFNSSSNDYPIVQYKGKSVLVTRLVIHLLHGKRLADNSWKALHACDNTMCVNKKHLRAGTSQDNVRDAFVRGRWRGRRRIQFCPEDLSRTGLMNTLSTLLQPANHHSITMSGVQLH